jgi:hypothetical protein
VDVEPQRLARAALRGVAKGGEAREVIERLVPGLDVVRIQFLIIEGNHGHPLLVIFRRI